MRSSKFCLGNNWDLLLIDSVDMWNTKITCNRKEAVNMWRCRNFQSVGFWQRSWPRWQDIQNDSPSLLKAKPIHLSFGCHCCLLIVSLSLPQLAAIAFLSTSGMWGCCQCFTGLAVLRAEALLVCLSAHKEILRWEKVLMCSEHPLDHLPAVLLSESRHWDVPEENAMGTSHSSGRKRTSPADF